MAGSRKRKAEKVWRLKICLTDVPNGKSFNGQLLEGVGVCRSGANRRNVCNVCNMKKEEETMVRIKKSLRQKLKAEAAEKGVTLQELVEQKLTNY